MLAKWLERLFGNNPTDIAESRMADWQDWIQPINLDMPTGEDIAYEDDFEAIKNELAKLSGIDALLIIAASERLLKLHAKDLRVAVYFTFANLRESGLNGFAGGLELTCSLLKTYPQNIWPQKPMQRRSAVAWLCSDKILDALSASDLGDKQALERALSALILLQNLLVDWEEAFRPNMSPLLQKFEQTLADSSYGQQETRAPVSTDNVEKAASVGDEAAVFTPAISISSAKMLLDQTRVIAAYLRQQENGYWAAYKMIRAVRWGHLVSPPPANHGQTRLKPPRTDLQATLKRLVLEKQWLDLLERVEMAFLEGANHYWLDLQYYAWQGQKALGGLYAAQADLALGELKILLSRCDGLETLNFEDGSPFVSDNVAEWLQKEILPLSAVHNANVSRPSEAIMNNAEISYEDEAMKIVDDEGLEAAMIWLDSQLPLQAGKLLCQKFFIMARLADRQQRSDWAIHLLEQNIVMMQAATVEIWDKEFAFDIHSMLYKLLFAKSKRKDMLQDAGKIQVQIEQLQRKLMQIDAVRALSVFH